MVVIDISIGCIQSIVHAMIKVYVKHLYLEVTLRKGEVDAL